MDHPQAGPATSGGRPRVLQVSELAAGIKGLLEDEVGRVQVVGEIGDLFRARSGHCYFTLKDDSAQLRAVLFRGNLVRIPFDPENGLEVIVLAELSFYEPRGDVQLIVRSLEPRGQGALQLAFEQLRARLADEGLFDPAHKRALPPWPRRIGVVTSPVGAALHDVIEVTGRRAPGIPLLLAPTRVQGEGAEAEIEAALKALAGQDVDLILLVRGGGSLEDLVAFNSERVARAIRASGCPVVAGVGHEIDVTIADLAADARAPTPSAAAELAVPDLAPLRDRLQREGGRLCTSLRNVVERHAVGLDRLTDRLHSHSPRARLARQREGLLAARRGLVRGAGHALDRNRADLRAARARLLRHAQDIVPADRPAVLARRLARVGPELLAARRARLAAQVGRLHALSPLAVLARGFSIVRAEGSILRRAADASPGDALDIQLGEGTLQARVVEEDA